MIKQEGYCYGTSQRSIRMRFRDGHFVNGCQQGKRIFRRTRVQCGDHEARPTEALNLAQSGRLDFITFTSPLQSGDYGMPTVNAFACLTGVGEDEFFAEIEKIAHELKR